jgi:hypothetical protein
MKAIHNKASKHKWEYPCIGISSAGEVVGFFSDGVGTVLSNPQYSRKLMEPFSAWVMSSFTPLPSTESITLQND